MFYKISLKLILQVLVLEQFTMTLCDLVVDNLAVSLL